MQINKTIFNICSDPILKDRLAQRGIEAQVFDAVLGRDEKIAFLESLESFACGWFFTDKKIDYTEYRNVSIGSAIHDELMIFFYLSAHFIYLLDKLIDKHEIVFYHSTSCLMPESVIDLLSRFNVRVNLLVEKYPWLSYREQLEKQKISNFSRISFVADKRGCKRLKQALGQIRLTLRLIISRLFFKMHKRSKKAIYFHAHRSLISFYQEQLKKDRKDFDLYITDTTPLEPKLDKKRRSIIKDTRLLFQLALKGITLDMLTLPFYYRWYIDYKAVKAYKRLSESFAQGFRSKVEACFEIKNKVLLNYFSVMFSGFYLEFLPQFMRLIDFYYEKFSKTRINMCLQEMCHPFQAQVLANVGIPCRIYPSNHVIHNQYFTPTFFKKVGHFIKPVAISELDAQRFSRLGFDYENIKIIDSSFSKSLRDKITPFHRIDSLRGKKVLILAPSIIAINSFRYQVQNESLFKWFNDVFEIFFDLKVTSVTIRPHPGANVTRNRFGYTDNDILKFLVDRVESSKKAFTLNFSDSFYHNLEADILSNDIVLGNITGALFELLIYGRDYIHFDDTLTPNYGVKDWTIFNEGTIKRLTSKEELREYLTNYVPSDIEGLRNRFFMNGYLSGSEDPFGLL